MASIVAILSGLNQSTFSEDESARLQVLNEARSLAERLEKPWEKVDRLVRTQPTLLLAVKAASDMNLFAALSSEPKTCEQLGKATHADPLLVARMLRLLASCHVVQEADVNSYVESNFSRSLSDPNGVVNGIHDFYNRGVQQLEKLPLYLSDIGYKNPSDAANPPWKAIMGVRESMWEWFNIHPEAKAHFQSYLSSIRVEQPPWPSYYPVSRLLNSYDPSTILCVDVGGGKGRDMKHLAETLAPQLPHPKIVLQDLPAVINEAQKEGLPACIELVSHNFFTPNPVRGARAYFLHSILHDWPDSEAHNILARVKEAGTPGYSKILLLEAVMPQRVKDVQPRMAALDLTMMAHYSALERTEQQWRALLEGAGLQFTSFWELKGHPQGVIEAQI